MNTKIAITPLILFPYHLLLGITADFENNCISFYFAIFGVEISWEEI